MHARGVFGLEQQWLNTSATAKKHPKSSKPAPVLVFLHEGLGCVQLWRDWPAQLSAATDLAGWVYSRQGYGQSPVIPDVRGTGRHGADYMHRHAFETLPQLLAHEGIKTPVLIGHSDGATIALLYASRYPTAACVAIAPHVVVEPIAVEAIAAAKLQYEQTTHQARGLRQRLAKYHADPDCAFWQWNDVWLSPAFQTFNIEAECQNIKAPLLVLQGQSDPYGTLLQPERIAAAAPQTAQVLLPACGHSPHTEQPAASLAAISQWLCRVL